MSPRTLHATAFTALVAALVAARPAPAQAQEPIRFVRTPDVSPDGRLVAFSYLGDIWVVESIGGVARPVTLHEAHDIYPVFSPDGRQLAFASNRYGSYDVFTVPVAGGRPKRLTSDSATDIPVGWSPDGKEVLMVSGRAVAYPSTTALYTVPAAGGAVRSLGIADAKDGSFSPQGDRVAYVRGQGTWYRKGYRGSSNDDLWLANRDGTGHRRLTDFTGQDTSPMWAPDGHTLYYVSEQLGAANVFRLDLTAGDKAKPTQITFHTDDAVRRARISGNGEWIVYECGADLYVVSTLGGSPRKLAIEVHADEKTNSQRVVTLTRDATEFAPAPDEKHVVLVAHGELFLTALPDGGKATRLTNDPAYDHGIAWAPDGKKIVFASDRTGHEDLYLLEADDPDTTDLTKATKFKVKPLTQTPEAESDASFSPDGKRIAYLRTGQLWTMSTDGSNAKPLVADVQVFDYHWSPDSKWLVYARTDGSYASELYIVPSAGGQPRNVTRYATYNGDVTWSKNGKKIAFISQRRGNPAVHILALQKPSSATPPSGPFAGPLAGLFAGPDIDWDDIHLRVTRPTPVPADDCAIAPDGSRVAFRSNGDLWTASADGRQVQRVTTGGQQPRQIRWSQRHTGQVYYLDGTGTVRIANLGTSGLVPPDPARVPFSAKLTFRRDEEFREMFAQSWRLLAENFYDPAFHGADWKAVRAKYAGLVKHVALKEDLYALISLMLGELNASHLGIFGAAAPPEEITADLGLLFDESYRGPGLKVTEVLRRGPADKRGLNLKPGDLILSIDRQPVTGDRELSELLNGKVGETVPVEVAAAGADLKDPKARRKVELQAVGRDVVENLIYERWVNKNAERVAALSGGKYGYIHIPNMSDDGLERFVRSLYSDNFDKDGLVIDVRNNGGGFTHDQVLNYLAGREHALFKQRNGGEGMVVREYDRKWTKPLVVLINHRTYSDAEVFPNALRTLNLGKLVGQPTGGQVIFTYRVRLIDGSVFMLPRTGVYTTRGVNMEKEAVKPDVLVEPTPDQIAKGADPQLEKAVDVLRGDLLAWQQRRNDRPGAAGSTTPAAAATTPATTPGGGSN
jgi:tricorn protease